MRANPHPLAAAATPATAPDDEFTALARLAAAALDAPIGFVSLLLGEQCWTRAQHGADFELLSHDHALATHVTRTRSTLSISDICADTNWCDKVFGHISLAACACVAAPILLCSGAAAGAVCVLDRRQREWTRGEIEQVQDFAQIAAALLQDRMISSAMDAASDGIAMVDASERFFYMNQAHAAQFGYSCPTELLGKPWTILCDDAEIARIRAKAFPQVWSAGAWTGSSIGRRRDGSHFPQEITLTRLPTGGIICATRDVSERKALEAETSRLTEMRARAEAASAAKSAFLAQVSHEIRTPLNAVMGLASVLGRGALDERQREIVGLISASSQTIERLLRDILDIARIEAGKLTLELAPFDLRTAVYAAAQLAQVEADGKNIGCFVEVTASAQGSFLGDEFRIRQLLLNLAANAVKFTHHGEVRILVDVREAADGGAAEVAFEVKDTGIGFPAEEAARLFQCFEQADALIARAYGGTGLGLSICKALADAMGGAIHAQSAPGLGSTFTLVLPLARAEAPVRFVAAQSLPAGAPLRILVAEDHPSNRRVIELILESANAEIAFASNGVEAVHARRGGEFHVILMDVLMPEMDGVTAVRAIRAFEAATGANRTPIAMLSANARDDQRALALSAGADYFITKPLTATALLEGVAYAIEAGQRKDSA